jgi:hypothetical protein
VYRVYISSNFRTKEELQWICKEVVKPNRDTILTFLWIENYSYINIHGTGLKQAKGLTHIPGPSARRTKDLLKVNRDQLGWVVGLFTGHCHLKGHLFKLGLTDDPIRERCLEEDE